MRIRSPIHTAGALLLALMTAGTGCGDDWFNFGDPRIQNEPLKAGEHDGWRVANCGAAGCHDPTRRHEGAFTTAQCVACHGSNGAPALTADHPGWNVSVCGPCHPSPAGHGTVFADGDCGTCHGGNGGPALTEGHHGYLVADCFACHPQENVHAGVYALGQCTPCHGANGAPPRPARHWMLRCNDCHIGGPYPWNEATHTGLDRLDPDGCAGCHVAGAQ